MNDGTRIATAKLEARRASEEEANRPVPIPKGLEDIEPTFSEGRMRAYSADSMRAWAKEPVDFRIPNVLVRGTHGVVGAPKKALKSTLVGGDLPLALANSIPWLGSELLPVEKPASVILIINEGLKPYMRALERLAQAKGLDSYGDITIIPATGILMGDEDLEAIVRAKAATVDDLVLIYDATYGLVGSDKEASSLFSMNDVLVRAQNIGTEVGADTWLIHHFRKKTTGRPDLDDLSWAGFAEWADSWMLLTHREPPNASEGEFRLGMVSGSRHGFETLWEIDADLGKMEDGEFSHLPKFKVEKVDNDTAAKWGKNGTGDGRSEAERVGEAKAALRNALSDEPFTHGKTHIIESLGLRKDTARKAWDDLVASDYIVSETIPGEDSRGHSRPQRVWGIADDSPTARPIGKERGGRWQPEGRKEGVRDPLPAFPKPGLRHIAPTPGAAADGSEPFGSAEIFDADATHCPTAPESRDGGSDGEVTHRPPADIDLAGVSDEKEPI